MKLPPFSISASLDLFDPLPPFPGPPPEKKGETVALAGLGTGGEEVVRGAIEKA